MSEDEINFLDENIIKCNRIEINFLKNVKEIKKIKIIKNKYELNLSIIPLITSLIGCKYIINKNKYYYNKNNFIKISKNINNNNNNNDELNKNIYNI